MSASAASAALPGSAPTQHQHARFMELLDLLKSEFENTVNDTHIRRQEREEWESRINAQISEQEVMWGHLHELKDKHMEMKIKYEEELSQLRRELASRPAANPNTGSGPAPNLANNAALFNNNGNGNSANNSQKASKPPQLQKMPSGDSRDTGNKTSAITPAIASPSAPVPTTLSGTLCEQQYKFTHESLRAEGGDWEVIWNPSTAGKTRLEVTPVYTLTHDSVVCCVRFSADGTMLATGCNRTAQIFDTSSGTKVCALADETILPSKADPYIRSVCFSPDGTLLATGAEDKQIRIWDIAKKQIKNYLQGHTQEIYSLDFSPDGKWVASGSGDRMARLWDLQSGECLHTYSFEASPTADGRPSDAGITSVIISPDGKYVVAGSLDTKIRLWDTVSGALVQTLSGHKDSVYSVSFSSNGKYLVSGSLDSNLRVWDFSSVGPGGPDGKNSDEVVPCRTFSDHKDFVLSVAITADCKWVASGSKDRNVVFWDAQSGEPHLVLKGHKNSVISTHVSKSNLFATGSGDYFARIWQLKEVPFEGSIRPAS